MDPPLVNEASFTASANPSSYSLAGLLSFPISGNGGLGLKMGGGDGGASLEESTVTTDQSGRGGIKRTRTARDEEDNAAANFFDHHNHHHHMRESAVKRSKSSGSKDENCGIKTEAKANSGTSVKPVDEKSKPEPLKDYIHVRARRGQATDSHSLAERARREKISERMKLLQDLVPGCNKVIGKALVLDEIINYVQSLQCQVEFLSMKLEAVNSRMNPAVEGFPSKGLVAPISDASGLMYGSQAHREYAQGTELEWLQMQVRSGFQRAT